MQSVQFYILRKVEANRVYLSITSLEAFLCTRPHEAPLVTQAISRTASKTNISSLFYLINATDTKLGSHSATLLLDATKYYRTTGRKRDLVREASCTGYQPTCASGDEPPFKA
jgi:hypothetical protein